MCLLTQSPLKSNSAGFSIFLAFSLLLLSQNTHRMSLHLTERFRFWAMRLEVDVNIYVSEYLNLYNDNIGNRMELYTVLVLHFGTPIELLKVRFDH